MSTEERSQIDAGVTAPPSNCGKMALLKSLRRPPVMSLVGGKSEPVGRLQSGFAAGLGTNLRWTTYLHTQVLFNHLPSCLVINILTCRLAGLPLVHTGV